MSLVKSLKKWAGRGYSRLPDALDRALTDGLAAAREIRQRTIRFEVLSNDALRLVVVGRNPTVDYFLRQLPGGPLVELTSQSIRLSELVARLQARPNEVDLMLLRLPQRWLGRHPQTFDHRWWRVPEAVSNVVDVPDAPDAKPPWHNDSNNNNRARIRHNRLTWSISHDPSDFDYFYHRMYRPFIDNRFGDLSMARSEHRMRRGFRQGCLMWILQDQRRLAATLFRRRGNMLYSLLSAVEPKHPEAVKLGALSASYLFTLQWAMDHGCRHVHLGASRPSPVDGVLVHKKYWGASLTETPEARCDLLWRWLRFTPHAQNFLHRTPLVVRDEDRFSALTAAPTGDEPDPSQFQVHLNRIAAPGLWRLHVIADLPWRLDESQVRGHPLCWLSSDDAELPITT